MTRTREENAADLAYDEARRSDKTLDEAATAFQLNASRKTAYDLLLTASMYWHDDMIGDESYFDHVKLVIDWLAKPERIFLVNSCNEYGDGVTVHRTIEEAEAKRCEDFETEEKPGTEAWSDEWLATYQNASWYCWEIEVLNLDTLEIEATTREDVVDWDKVAELVGWEDPDADEDDDEQPDEDELTSAGSEPVTIEVEDRQIEASLAVYHDGMGRRWVRIEGRYYQLTLPKVVRVRTDFEADAAGMIAAKERKDVQADQ